MKAEDTVLDTIRIYNITGIDIVEVGQWRRIRPALEAQAEISFKAGIDYEQKRMTKALRELHKDGWTLSEVVEAEDTIGGNEVESGIDLLRQDNGGEKE